MIARLYVWPRKESRVLACYLLDSELSSAEVRRAGEVLTNPLLEKFSVNKIPLSRNISYILEIGYLPGVTDNLGHSAEESIRDALGLSEDARLKIYSSKVFLIYGKAGAADVKKFADPLYNPLIERALILSRAELERKGGLPLEAPEVLLKKRTPVIKVSLNIPDEDLIRLGTEGIRKSF